MAGLAAQLRDLFTQNLGYKVVALLLGLLLWFDVTTDETAVIEYPVPLSIAVEGRDMIITNDVPHEVDVRFSGSGKELLRLDKDQLAIRKEVRGGESDTVQVDLSPQDVQRPGDLDVVPTAVVPGRITVVTDRFIERTVPLAPVGAPDTGEGYQVVNLQVDPRRVTVRGITAEVRPIGSLPLDLSQIAPGPGSFDERLEIAVPESLGTVRVTPDSVRIRGRVAPLRPEVEE
ncbi:MAG: CdaR family protein [Gemmatimonadota bacterium]